jgi:ABC-2 type transport system ATP-binding protein
LKFLASLHSYLAVPNKPHPVPAFASSKIQIRPYPTLYKNAIIKKVKIDAKQPKTEKKGRNRMIKIENVSKTFGGKVKAVNNLNMTIEGGEIFGFLGPNGAGKTTTIKMITGILSPDAGRITINGYDIKKDTLEAKKQIGFVPDDPNVFLRLKGLEYLNFMADVYDVPSKIRKERIGTMGERFGMSQALGDQIQSYSHGMRQKIVLMGALIHNPDVWILDEPMTGLDPKSSFVLKEMMREHVNAGKIVFFSTHVLDVAEKLCDRVAIINKGNLLFNGKIQEMREKFEKEASLEKIFLELTVNE